MIRRMRIGLTTVAILTFLPCFAQERVAADGLAVSPSGHFFVYEGRDRFLLHDSGSQCVLQNLNLDYAGWVAALASEGHPGAHVWAFVAPRQKLDGSVVERRYGYVYPGVTPWSRAAGGSIVHAGEKSVASADEGSTAYDGGPPYDLFTFDEGEDPQRHYWPRLRDLCRCLKERSMTLGITVFFGWPKDPEDFLYHPFAEVNGGPARTRNEITHIAEPGTEIHDQPYDPNWPRRKKTQWHWERFCLKLIDETSAFGNVWFDFRDEWSYDNDTNMEDHFRRFFMDRGQLWADRSDAADIRTANPVVPSSGATPAVKTEGGPYEPDEVLEEVWLQALSGVHYLLHSDSRLPGMAAWDPVVAAREGLDPHDDPARRYVGVAARFFHERIGDLDRFLPYPDLTNSKLCLAVPGEEYVIFVQPGTMPAVNLIDLTGPAAARFLDLETGDLLAPVQMMGGGRVTVATPDRERPWVLWLRAQEAGGTVPR